MNAGVAAHGAARDAPGDAKRGAAFGSGAASPARGLVGRWTAAFVAGELLGFGAAALVLGLAWLALAPLPRLAATLGLHAAAMLGGLVEGAVLASFQVRVLARALPAVDARRWVRWIALAGAAAWGAGMLSPTLDDLVGLSALGQVAVWVPAGVFILLSIGTAQARVLAGAVPRPGRWIGANALGWLLGPPWTFVIPPLLPEDSPLVVLALGVATAGAAMGATVGLVTALWLARMSAECAARRA